MKKKVYKKSEHDTKIENLKGRDCKPDTNSSARSTAKQNTRYLVTLEFETNKKVAV